MCIALVGGMDRLRKHYEEEAERSGIALRVFNAAAPKMAAKIRNVDAVVVFTNKVSHTARREVLAAARSAGVPVYCIHSCGVCTLRDCLSCLTQAKEEESDAAKHGPDVSSLAAPRCIRGSRLCGFRRGGISGGEGNGGDFP